MEKRAKVAVGVAAGVAVLVGVGLAVGPGLYADWAEGRADDAPSLSASGGPVEATDGTWTVSAGSFAGYRLDEVLQGRDVTVTGRTEDVTGEVTVADGAVTAATVEVDLTTVATDEPARDLYFRDRAIQVGTFPTATFVLTEPAELAADGTSARLVGDLTIRDVTQQVTVEAQVASTADGVQVVGSVPVTFADFGVEAPDLGFVTVEDAGFVEFDLRLTTAG